MAATASLSFEVRPTTANSAGDVTSAKASYKAVDAADESEALVAVRAAAPSTYEGLFREEFVIRNRISQTAWDVDVIYIGNASEVTQAFDTTGATEHLDVGFEQIAALAPAGETAPSVSGAIGVEGTTPGAPVKGVDVVSRTSKFSETHYLSQSFVTASYKRKLAKMTSTYNLQVFRGYDPVDVLFLGAAGRIQGNGKGDVWEITFNFAYSPTQTAFSVGSIEVPRKRGWEYMWVMYSDEISQGRFVKTPVAVYINRVYEGSTFSGLGIGTGEL